MSPQRIVFDEPIVRAETQKMKFPEICPVCGDPAEDIMPIIIIPNQYKSLRPSLDYMFPSYGPRQSDALTRAKKTLQIPVCVNHHYTDEGAERTRSYCIVFDGLALVYLILAMLAFGNEFWTRGHLNPWMLFGIAIFGFFLVLTYAVFRPGPVEDAIKIIGFDRDLHHIWIQFKRTQYRDEFMKENTMTAELVKWIRKA